MAGRPTLDGPALGALATHSPRMPPLVRRITASDTVARLVRWWIVGLIALGADLGAIYLAHEVMELALPIAALVAGEAVQLARFLAVDRWVFSHRRPTWTRLWQYHVACFSAMVLHWLALNGLAFLGLHYLLATVAATGVTVTWSMVTNFLWIWRRKPVRPSVARKDAESAAAPRTSS